MNTINERITAIGVVPVIKLNNPARDAAPLARALCAGNVPVAEVTFRAAGADTAIRLMREACPDMLVGAGTVLTREHVDKAAAAGADFIVTPGFDADLSRLHHPHRLSRGAEIRVGSAQILPRRTIGRSVQDQGDERPVPDVQSDAHRRYFA